MTQHAISWTHDGQPAATLEAPSQRNWYGARHVPVECAVSFTAGHGHLLVWAFQKRSFVDAGCGWVGAHFFNGLLGAWCFQRAVAKNIRELTIALDNATTDRATHKGAVYFSDLRFEFEPGWTVLHFSLPAVPADATQFFPALAQLTRRFVLYRGDNRAAAYDHLFNPPRRSITQFGPSRIPLALGTTLAEEHRIRDILASGKPAISQPGAGELGFYTANLGVWFPHGDPKAYAHGGEDIFPVPRLGSPVWHQIRSDAIAERQRAIAPHPNGRPIEAHEWSSDFEYQCDRGGNMTMRLPPFRDVVGDQWRERKFNAGTCAYEADIATRIGERGYSAYDPHHGCRAILDALAHYYLTGCPLNRLRVQLAAQDYMTAYRITKVGNEDRTQGWVPLSLHRLISDASRQPKSGGRIQRELAWISWTVAHAIAITPPSDPMRARMQEWMRVFFEYLGLVRLENGAFYAGWPPWSDDGIPWNLEALQSNGWPGRALSSDEAEMPIFQTGLLVAGIDEAAYAIGFDASDWIGTLARWVYGRPDLWVRDAYDPHGRGPFWYSRVYSRTGGADRENTDGVGNAHTIHSRDTLARAYRRTGDDTFLKLALGVAHPIPRMDGEDAKSALRRTFKNSTDPWSATVRAVTERNT